MATPSNEEQLALELINQLRTDPDGEYVRLMALSAAQPNVASALSFFGVTLSALQNQLTALSPVAPLAWNSALNVAATTHSQAMIDEDEQSHQLPGEPDLGTRIGNAGYANLQGAGENVYAFSDDTAFGHAGFVVDWGYDAVDFDGNVLRADWQTRGDGIQDGAGQRANMLDAFFTEVGVGIIRETNAATEVGEYVTTHNFATRFGYKAQFVGVVIDDADGDSFYDVGEGLGGVTVRLTNGAATYQTTSWSSGGWQIEVPAGNYTITFSGGGLDAPIVRQATLGAVNVKVDAIDGEDTVAVPTNGDDVLVGTNGADTINALAGNDRVDGLAGADRLYGLGGGDRLSGDAGNDLISGGADRDILYGGTGHDTVVGGDGNDSLFGDAGADTLSGSNANDICRGGSGNDTVNGGAGNDSLFGDDGSDTLSGNSGNDVMRGGADNDRLIGAAGVDNLDGGVGTDSLTGGADADVFIFGNGYAADTIAGFQDDIDTIRLDDLLWGGGKSVAQVLADHATQTSPGIVTLDFGGGDILKIVNGSGISIAALENDIAII